jgi:hypothetical protein
MEVDIKVVCSNSAKRMNKKPHLLAGDRKLEMSILSVLHMKTRRGASQAAVKSEANRVLRQAKSEATEDSKHEEGSIG